MGSSSSVVEFGAAIQYISHSRISPGDHEHWRAVFTTPFTPLDLANALSPAYLRRLRRHRPENLAAMLYKCIEQIETFEEQTTTSDAATRTQQDTTKSDGKELLKWSSPQAMINALQIIARIMPFVLEPCTDEAGEHGPPQESTPDQRSPDVSTSTEPFVSNEQKEASRFCEQFVQHFFVDGRTCNDALPDELFESETSLGVRMVMAVVKAAFVGGFTIDMRQVRGGTPPLHHPNVDPNVLWIAGLCSKNSAIISFNVTMFAHRNIVLRTLISILSTPLYARSSIAADVLFRDVMLDKTLCPLTSTLVCSLLGTVAAYNPAGLMPYTSHLISEQESLVYSCAQLLCLLLDSSPFLAVDPAAAAECASTVALIPHERRARAASTSLVAVPEEDDVDERRNNTHTSSGTLQENMNLHAAWSFVVDCTVEECGYILMGLQRLLCNVVRSKITYLPGSQRCLSQFEPFVILLWRLVDHAPHFPRVFWEGATGLLALAPLAHLALTAIDVTSKSPLLHLVVFIWLKLSGSREFILRCNVKFMEHLAFWLPLSGGTYNDLILLTLSTVMTHKHQVPTLCESMMIVMCNISPYMTSILPSVCERLMTHLHFYSRVEVLKANTESSSFILSLVVETVANLLQYQYPASAWLLYKLVICPQLSLGLYFDVSEGKLPISPKYAEKLLVKTIRCAVEAALPTVCSLLPQETSEAVVAALASKTCVGLLPVPHNIITRRYQPKVSTDAWLFSVLWGHIFSNSTPFVLADAAKVTLFKLAD